MKHLTQQDVMVLLKLVNQADETFAAVEDTAQVIRRHDREYKALPPEVLEEADKSTVAVRDARRKLSVIRNRLIAELQETGLTSR